MKKVVFLLASAAVILACLAVAVTEYNNHKTTALAAQTSAVQKAQADVIKANSTLKLHDAVNAANLAALNQQKAVLCAQVKAARLVQPLCK